jgi:hypothetical protein
MNHQNLTFEETLSFISLLAAVGKFERRIVEGYAVLIRRDGQIFWYDADAKSNKIGQVHERNGVITAMYQTNWASGSIRHCKTRDEAVDVVVAHFLERARRVGSWEYNGMGWSLAPTHKLTPPPFVEELDCQRCVDDFDEIQREEDKMRERVAAAYGPAVAEGRISHPAGKTLRELYESTRRTVDCELVESVAVICARDAVDAAWTGDAIAVDDDGKPLLDAETAEPTPADLEALCEAVGPYSPRTARGFALIFRAAVEDEILRRTEEHEATIETYRIVEHRSPNGWVDVDHDGCTDLDRDTAIGVIANLRRLDESCRDWEIGIVPMSVDEPTNTRCGFSSTDVDEIDADDEIVELCAYCGELVETLDVPDEDDDDAWKALESEHNDGCEWVLTRAHSRI